MNHALAQQVKKVLIDGLHLEEVDPDTLDVDTPLFGDELGLDSVDALELVLEIERHFGHRLGDDEHARSVLTSVRTLTDWIDAQGPK